MTGVPATSPNFDEQRYVEAYELLRRRPSTHVPGWGGARTAVRRYANALSLLDDTDKLHCDDGPAEVVFEGDPPVIVEADWVVHGELRVTQTVNSPEARGDTRANRGEEANPDTTKSIEFSTVEDAPSPAVDIVETPEPRTGPMNVKLYVAPFPVHSRSDFEDLMARYRIDHVHLEVRDEGDRTTVSASTILTDWWPGDLPGIIARDTSKSPDDLTKWRHLIADIETALSDDLVKVWAEEMLPPGENIYVTYAGTDDEDEPVGGAYVLDSSGDLLSALSLHGIFD